MRFSRVIWFSAIAALLSPFSVARAQDENYAEVRAAARRELMLAKMELRQYQLVEYPRLRRHLQAQIDLTEAEIRDYLAGNLCRCAAYPEIINAVKSAARKMQARETA